ncbi:MAG: type II toxin-antitoxin system HicB family antitoxin [Patescibacteria group bacterium]
MKSLRYNIILHPEPEGGFTVIVPALPGCVTYGKNLSVAKNMALDAIQAYLSSLAKHREPFPTDEESFITSVTVKNTSRAHIPVHA